MTKRGGWRADQKWRGARRLRFLSVPPLIDSLENRLMLSTIVWDSTNHPTGGSWDTGSNWVGGQVPQSTDDAVINLTGTGTVTLSTGVTDTVNSLTTSTNSSLSISSDTLSLATTSSIGGGLTLTGGTIGGSGALTVTGLTTWTGGTMSGTGTTNANGGLTMGGVGANDQMFLTGRTLNNAGAATLSENTANTSYGLLLGSGAAFDNEAGASFAFATGAEIINSGGTPAGGTFVNAGTLSKTGGTGTSVVNSGVTLTDTGAVQA
ncbi:MAG: hypothetical protein ACHRXM_14860, partial [Isosphaerales bacterium]